MLHILVPATADLTPTDQMIFMCNVVATACSSAAAALTGIWWWALR